MIAILDAMRSGILTGDVWSLDIVDRTGTASDLLPGYLRLIRAVDGLWGNDIAPKTVYVTVDDARFVYSQEDDYEKNDAVVEFIAAQLSIRLEIDKTALDPLPPPENAGVPQIVIRSAHLPAIVGDDLYEGTARRFIAPDQEADIRTPLTEIMRAVFAKSEFREGQFEAVSQLLTGGDCAVLLPTGGGKSLIYQLAGLCLPGRTLVVDPLIALMEDQVRGLDQHGIDRVATISAYHLTHGDRDEVLRQVRSGDALFIFIAPERLQKRDFRSAVRALAQTTVINLAVIDEAHCVSEWGHQFRLSYLTLGATIRSVCRDSVDTAPPIVALTGTASRAVLRDVLNQLGISAEEERSIIRPKSFDREELQMISIASDPSESEATLIGILSSMPGRFNLPRSEFFRPRGKNTTSGVVFCPHRSWERGVWSISQLVRGVSGVQPAIYAGGAPSDLPRTYGSQDWEELKRANADAFINDQNSVMVTTNAFGMGIDKPNIRYVLHYGMPGSIEAFYQEVGRAGRDGQRAVTGLLITELDETRNRELLGPNLENTRENHSAIRRRDADDITRQLYFLLNTFQGVEPELEQIEEVIAEIEDLGGLGQASTLELAYGKDESSNTQRERAIYRLMMLGAISDYTKEGSFVIDLRPVQSHEIPVALRAFILRNFPGSTTNDVPTASDSLPATLIDCSRVLIDRIYESIVASRVRSLNEMYLAARDSTSNESLLRQRVLDYLTQGDVAPIFETLMDSPEFEYGTWINELSNYREEEAGELRGTAARLLVAAPDHPGLLYARAFAEIVHKSGEWDTLQSNLTASVEFAVDRYGSDSDQIDDLFSRLLTQLESWDSPALVPVMEVAREVGAAQETRTAIANNVLQRPNGDLNLLVLALAESTQGVKQVVTTAMGRLTNG
jgi:ATP-dependent DNA helicase RecQ